MGCGSSRDADAGGGQRPADQRGGVDGQRKGRASDASNPYAQSASPLASEAERIHDEIDQRSASHFSAAEEPSNAVRALRFQAIVTRGKMVNNVNEDPDQYADLVESPEFKRKDRKRVEEWVQQVGVAHGVSGPKPIPLDVFYLADPDDLDGGPSDSAAGATTMMTLPVFGGGGATEEATESTENSARHHPTDGMLSAGEESARQMLLRQQRQHSNSQLSANPLGHQPDNAKSPSGREVSSSCQADSGRGGERSQPQPEPHHGGGGIATTTTTTTATVHQRQAVQQDALPEPDHHYIHHTADGDRSTTTCPPAATTPTLTHAEPPSGRS